jgi:hypothetical protein
VREVSSVCSSDVMLSSSSAAPPALIPSPTEDRLPAPPGAPAPCEPPVKPVSSP